MAITSSAEGTQSTPIPMKLPGLQGGNDHDSYSRSSQSQNFMFNEYGKPHLSQALQHALSTFLNADATTATSLLRVADLGCSHGPNTLELAHFIVQAIAAQGAFMSHKPQELQYFFSDLPGNDFNALFRSLLPLGPQLQHFVDLPPAQMSVFGAGVPGSFYGRLFPQESLHLVVCNMSLHWLSQVPSTVVDRDSEAWNGGHVWIHGTRPKLCEAYARQFQIDAKAFLKSRVQELARGGILFIFAISRSELHPAGFYFDTRGDGNDFWMGDFDASWKDMVEEGVVSEEERDTFNVPMYNFHVSELGSALEGLKGDDVEVEVEVEQLDLLKKCQVRPSGLAQHLGRNTEAYGKTFRGAMASLAKPMVQAHLGEERAEDLFARVQHKTKERGSSVALVTSALDLVVATIRRRR